jgi:hypothetical protein
MTAVPGNVIPLRPTEADPAAQGAVRAARAREDSPPRRLRMPPAAAVGAIFTGASWVHGSPPSVMSIWALHKASADYLGNPWKYPRLAYGGFHAFVEEPVLYLLVLSGDSIPKRLSLYAVTALVLWLLHVI